MARPITAPVTVAAIHNGKIGVIAPKKYPVFSAIVSAGRRSNSAVDSAKV